MCEKFPFEISNGIRRVWKSDISNLKSAGSSQLVEWVRTKQAEADFSYNYINCLDIDWLLLCFYLKCCTFTTVFTNCLHLVLHPPPFLCMLRQSNFIHAALYNNHCLNQIPQTNPLINCNQCNKNYTGSRMEPWGTPQIREPAPKEIYCNSISQVELEPAGEQLHRGQMTETNMRCEQNDPVWEMLTKDKASGAEQAF